VLFKFRTVIILLTLCAHTHLEANLIFKCFFDLLGSCSSNRPNSSFPHSSKGFDLESSPTSDGHHGKPNLKDPLQVPDGPA